MQIRFVGSGDAFGNGGRFQTCIQIQGGTLTTLVDCGATSLTAMKAQGVNPGDVDAVVISHLHADHFGGVPLLILDGQFSRRVKPLTVIGPVGIHSRLHTTMEAAFPGSTAVQRRFDVDVIEVEGDGRPVTFGPMCVATWEVDHPSGAPALAVRVNLDGASFGYSGDTAWTSALERVADNTDVFACEAYTYDKPVPYHLDYNDVQAHADTLATGRLILTHLGASMLARVHQANCDLAHDGLIINLTK